MSIRHGLLALLERGPRYGSQLRTEFESRTGSTWPLNVGQVYTTLSRLERDGMVAQGGEDAAGHALYAITDSGRAELRTWFEKPVDRTSPARDELAIKLAMAVGASGVDIRDVIQSQRRHTVKAMQDYTRLKAQALIAVESGGARERDDIAWLLVLEQLIFQTEAEARWLDHCESRLIRLSATAADTGSATATTTRAATGGTPGGTAGGTAEAPTATAPTGADTAPTRTAPPEAASPVAGAR
ncbi:DNA-binding PadR family transcriptional regulator [Streptomyces sp. PvR006]|uniref:PadR family transcriptional regulator n=1 Tax=Streptomyces sp. PvR006 TaxID=2817860 RepID=UPI001FD95E18|nr:PadR family transcriptional regulator [Streptomyces sp. PvR006]MBP2583294.1 DNA-binding PadR family transcriptional regulator [Streptomyces sp. PvR006]